MIKDIEAEETRMAKLIEIVKPALTGLQTETRLSKAFVSFLLHTRSQTIAFGLGHTALKISRGNSAEFFLSFYF
jgi:hypothetical protein